MPHNALNATATFQILKEVWHRFTPFLTNLL